jgi:indole-3-glycerol phosphate synthase
MTILDTIIAKRKLEVAALKANRTLSSFEKAPFFSRTILSASARIRSSESTGIIAEHKRQSPSKGIINAGVQLAQVVCGYEQAGAACISVLTEHEHFGGSLQDLEEARKLVNIPLLRKDFMVDEFQILEARASGADFILLIAACLTPAQVRKFAQFAKSLDLEVLLEVHTQEELNACCPEIDMVGVNNRNLKDFSVNIERSVALISSIPKEFVPITESGLTSTEDIRYLKSVGFQGFLMGENFMKHSNPALACSEFISNIQ